MKRIATVLVILLAAVGVLGITTGTYTRDITGVLRKDAATMTEAVLKAIEYIIENGLSVDGIDATGWTVATKPINVPAGATTELVAAQASGKKIRVVGLAGMGNVSGYITLKSASTAISGVMKVVSGGGAVLPAIPAQNIPLHGWVQTAANEALNITTVTCEFDGMLIYATED